jgi:hypothetical protein
MRPSTIWASQAALSQRRRRAKSADRGHHTRLVGSTVQATRWFVKLLDSNAPIPHRPPRGTLVEA